MFRQRATIAFHVSSTRGVWSDLALLEVHALRLLTVQSLIACLPLADERV